MLSDRIEFRCLNSFIDTFIFSVWNKYSVIPSAPSLVLHLPRRGKRLKKVIRQMNMAVTHVFRSFIAGRSRWVIDRPVPLFLWQFPRCCIVLYLQFVISNADSFLHSLNGFWHILIILTFIFNLDFKIRNTKGIFHRKTRYQTHKEVRLIRIDMCLACCSPRSNHSPPTGKYTTPLYNHNSKVMLSEYKYIAENQKRDFRHCSNDHN